MVGVFVTFIRVVYGRMIYMSLPKSISKIGIIMRNVLMDEQHDPATMDISVFSIYMYTVWASFREEF